MSIDAFSLAHFNEECTKPLLEAARAIERHYGTTKGLAALLMALLDAVDPHIPVRDAKGRPVPVAHPETIQKP